jgi:hypothetical protein
MHIVKKIPLLLYECSIWVVLTDNMRKSIVKISGECTDLEADSEGLSLKDNIAQYLLFFNMLDSPFITYNCLGHELYHIVSWIKEDRSLDEESGGWIQGYALATIMKFLNKRGIEIK